jgi:uncharacterized membrane protein YjfL (UPF0719 family)
VWALGGIAILVIDFFTTRALFYDWQLKITAVEYRIAALCGVLVVAIIWILVKRMHIKSWYVDTKSCGLYR